MKIVDTKPDKPVKLVKMDRVLGEGEAFFYANKDTKQSEKCIVINQLFEHPAKHLSRIAYLAKNEISGRTFKCYAELGHGYFISEQEAYKNAQIE